VFQSFAERIKEDPVAMAHKREVMAKVEGLVDRAKEEGALRSDITIGDIQALTSAAAQAGGGSPRAAKRYLSVITDGMRA
jgi:hypothetical protein